MRMGKRSGQRGLSLLEVLITLMLLSTTLVAFAAVYPAAFKLNRKSQRSVQAAEIAGAVAEELRTLPFNRPGAGGSGGLFLEDFLTGWTADPRFARFPRTPVPPPFSLVSPSNPNNRGVIVIGDSPFTFASITVTVYWQEPVHGQMTERSVSIITSKTGNR